MKILALILIPVLVIRVFFWELVIGGAMVIVVHFIVKYW